MSQRDEEPGLDPPVDDLTAGIFGPTPASVFGLRAVLASYALAISVTVLVITALLRGSAVFMAVLASVALVAFVDLVVIRRSRERRSKGE